MPAGGRAFWLRAGDGTRLRAMVWNADDTGIAQVRGTVFLFGGRTEFAEKYFETIRDLIARGFAVATLDWRGQGLSQRALPDPRKGHVSDFACFDDDIGTFMAEVAPLMPRPWIGLAHSMGGNALMRLVHDRPGIFAACVMTAPMLGLNLGSPFVARVLSNIARVGQALGLGERYVPGGVANGLSVGQSQLVAADSLRFAAAHLSKGELVEIAGSHHEIMIETDEIRAQFWKAFDDFVARSASLDGL